VWKTDLTATLHSLLHRLGVPVDLSEGSVLTRLVESNAESIRLEALLGQERLLAAETRSKLERISTLVKCQICLTQDVTHVMVDITHRITDMQKIAFSASRFDSRVSFLLMQAPCGHTICIACLQQVDKSLFPSYVRFHNMVVCLFFIVNFSINSIVNS
jgi:hypothetical protein